MNRRLRGLAGALIICTIASVCAVLSLARLNKTVAKNLESISTASPLDGRLRPKITLPISDHVIKVGFGGDFFIPVGAGPVPPEKCKYHPLEQNCTFVKVFPSPDESLAKKKKKGAKDPWKELDALVLRPEYGVDKSFERFKKVKPNGVTAQMFREAANNYPELFWLQGVAEVSVTLHMSTVAIPLIHFEPSLLNISGGNPADYLRDPVYVKPGLDYVYRGTTSVVSNCASRNGRESVVTFFTDKFKSRLNMTVADGVESPEKPLEKDRSAFIFDSIASCLNTAPWPEGLESKYDALRQYMFTFAFENVNEFDYVSEKVYQALLAGVVPVYMGAPNIDEFVPEGSIIKITDFQDYQSLADYLVYLSNNLEEYKKYFRWRHDERMVAHLRKRFLPLLDSWQCRLCRYTAGRLNGKKRSDWNKKDQNWSWPFRDP